MPSSPHPLVVVEDIETDLKSFLPTVRHQNITNDRIVALSFHLRGSILTEVHLSFAQRSDVPFSGWVKPRLDTELATWLPYRQFVFFETADKFDSRTDTHGFKTLHDTLTELRTRDRQPAAPLYLASRFMKRHSQYLFTPRHGVLPLYEPGSAGITSIRVLEKSNRLIGVRVDAKGQAKHVCWTDLTKSLADPRRLMMSGPWKELISLAGNQLVPFFSRQFGERVKRPEMILNIGSDHRIHFRFTSQAHTRMMAQFNMPWRVIGPPPIQNPQTCLVYQISGNGLEVENAPVTGTAPLASNLACTIQ